VGGNIYISKSGTKAKGAELARLEWPGDRIAWRIGTGTTASFRPTSKDSQLSVLEDYLPVARATWSTDGIDYSEEGFATLLSGPLSPDDPGRSEQTPAVLMLKLTVRNAASKPGTAHLWVATDPEEQVAFEDGELTAEGGQLLRARMRLPEVARATLATVPDAPKVLRRVHVEIPLGAKDERPVFMAIPFIPRLTAAERARLANLDYDAERAGVVKYWREATSRAVPFDVPERRFGSFARAVLAHIRISATKDPRSGLYMVPAASYAYMVFSNEAAFQCLMLDALGNHRLAGNTSKPSSAFKARNLSRAPILATNVPFTMAPVSIRITTTQLLNTTWTTARFCGSWQSITSLRATRNGSAALRPA